MKKRGIEFLYVPGHYYDTVEQRVGEIVENLAVLKQHGIMVDKDNEGYLLQIFTKPSSCSRNLPTKTYSSSIKSVRL